jgi:hypothetical protein
VNKRGQSRKRILKAGRIDFGIGSIDCIVRNISETGASLEVESPIGIPDTFDLVIVAERSRKPPHVVWRKEKRIGIRLGRGLALLGKV